MTSAAPPNEMPNELWVSLYETVASCSPPDYWPDGRWPAVFKQSRDRAVKYTRTPKPYTDRERMLAEALYEARLSIGRAIQYAPAIALAAEIMMLNDLTPLGGTVKNPGGK